VFPVGQFGKRYRGQSRGEKRCKKTKRGRTRMEQFIVVITFTGEEIRQTVGGEKTEGRGKRGEPATYVEEDQSTM